MELVGVSLAQAAVVFNAEQIRPEHGFHPKALIEAVAKRYNFMNVYGPLLGNARPNQSGHIFESGVFPWRGQALAIAEFGVFDDGVMISMYHTDDCKRFLGDITGWLEDEHEFRKSPFGPEIFYRSELVIRFAKSLDGVFSSFDAISNAISQGFREQFPQSAFPEVIRLDFGVDPARGHTPRPSAFTIERRIRIPFNENCYASGAAMETDSHLRVLQEIEDSIS